MSLEQAVQENTAALRELIALLPKGINADPVEKPIEKHAPKVEKHVTQHAPIAEKEAEALNGKAVTFDEVRTEFRKLVAADRPAAVNLLTQLGYKGLSEVKPEEYAALLADTQKELAAHG